MTTVLCCGFQRSGPNVQYGSVLSLFLDVKINGFCSQVLNFIVNGCMEKNPCVLGLY